jgi:hypothetical protein
LDWSWNLYNENKQEHEKHDWQLQLALTTGLDDNSNRQEQPKQLEAFTNSKTHAEDPP